MIGIAGKYYDSVFKNHLNNFLGNPRYSSIAEKILKEELSAPLNSNELVAAQDKFKKLIVLFKYRDIKKYAKKRLMTMLLLDLVRQACLCQKNPKKNM